MKAILVGGRYRQRSSVIDKLATLLLRSMTLTLHNGTTPASVKGNDLVIWAPDIPNEVSKHYPVKDKEAVLICSKVIHGDRTDVDAVSRIFDMHGNAVIAIRKEGSMFAFKLIDALGNVWADTILLEELYSGIMDFYRWSKAQIRTSFRQRNTRWRFVPTKLTPTYPGVKADILEDFITLNTLLADKVENSLGSRYFGNFSTRCMKLFPTVRLKSCYYLFSPRNSDKRRLKTDDFVLVKPPYYYGQRKPSVDAPVQIELYERFDDINFMIHGHAFIKHTADLGTSFAQKITENYFPCGDLREVAEISRLFSRGYRFVNIKNHGFILTSNCLVGMEWCIKNLTFEVHKSLRD